ncbi:hypothetical protein M408DRAFT_147288 [Serendipita vermifera MAFF 305830]|uniref:Uncharacterized protein n=1 Tax=Serendipita vermifera MAFF 305830 TaxID=933852 RepID=A0A0C3B794_SERVB|nr:hypothetical protein M408DRAFT_147288 [Serendipita vermifera MAFF 305830]
MLGIWPSSLSLKTWCPSTPPSFSFSNLEALKWSTPLCFSFPGLGDPTCLPKLSALEYNAENVSKHLLTTRPIRRLQVAGIHDRRQLSIAIQSSPGHLTHIIFKDFNGSEGIIKATPLLFAQLQHVGSIPWFSCQRDAIAFIDSHLSVLKLLPHLTSLDAVAGPYGNQWTNVVLVYLNKLHRKLRKVLVHGTRYFVWKRQGEIWEKQEVSRFTSWDIIRGACD